MIDHQYFVLVVYKKKSQEYLGRNKPLYSKLLIKLDFIKDGLRVYEFPEDRKDIILSSQQWRKGPKIDIIFNILSDYNKHGYDFWKGYQCESLVK